MGEAPDGLDFAAGKKLYTRCPHPPTAARMAARIQWLRAEEDSTGGVCTCAIAGVPVGIGEPCFDKLDAELAKAMMSLPAVKAFDGDKHVLQVKGRHDPCVLPRCPPLVEGMGALAVADACMRQRARQGSQLHTLSEHSEERPAKVARISGA